MAVAAGGGATGGAGGAVALGAVLGATLAEGRSVVSVAGGVGVTVGIAEGLEDTRTVGLGKEVGTC